MFVLGVDPGLTRCGYGVVSRTGRHLEAVAAGVVRTDPSLTWPSVWPNSTARWEHWSRSTNPMRWQSNEFCFR
ncbi:MAG: hypothetical protein CM1200mP26_23600 [Acidimicrobiales bacterium]|nr:MAG: hypothetical protein CM1200mP26_23600 [Acidimicrobiales bacterium]